MTFSDPETPKSVGNQNTPGTAYAVAIDGRVAFVADGLSGLQVIDVSDPTKPTMIGAVDIPGLARDVVVAGNHAFVADGTTGGLQVIDISDPTAPFLTAETHRTAPSRCSKRSSYSRT